ncbi:hypothetical protein SDC9_200462 [bioreactor metagenome]|uniref:Uncharacterized protein n=1 Tax=bioreactor metagenome TaxID=1076179 RepID=A0A645IR39_9ZZZZ
MKKISGVSLFLLFFILGTFLFSTAASAYIDPSAMTYIVQVIVGIIIASGAAIGFYFKKIKRKLKKEDKPQEIDLALESENFENDEEFDINRLTEEEVNQLNGKNE